MNKNTVPLVIVGAALIAVLIFQRRAIAAGVAASTNDEPLDEMPPTGNGNGGTLAAVSAGLAGATKLAGQGTQGGTPAKSPSAAIRTAGAIGAATGVVGWLQAKSNVGRTLAGAQTGAGIAAVAAGAALGAATLGISVGVGAVVGLVAGINKNDTKEARWDFAKGNGYTRDGNGFDKMIRVDLAKVAGVQMAEALWAEAVGRIGRKDNAWNNNWLDRVVRAFRGEQVHAYQNDPTKGANPIL